MIILLYDYIITLWYYYIIILLYHYIITLYYSNIILLYFCTITLLYCYTSTLLYYYIVIFLYYMVILELLLGDKSPTFSRILTKRVFYKWKTKSGGYSPKRDYIGNYKCKVIVLPKPWNDPTVIAVILVWVAWI